MSQTMKKSYMTPSGGILIHMPFSTSSSPIKVVMFLNQTHILKKRLHDHNILSALKCSNDYLVDIFPYLPAKFRNFMTPYYEIKLFGGYVICRLNEWFLIKS